MASSFGKRLRAARESAGKTQDDIAKLFGIKREAVASWEADRTFPTADKLQRLASSLKVSVDHLLGKARNLQGVSGRNDVEPGPDVRAQVPLISWVLAGKFSEAMDPLHVGQADEWYPIPRKAGAHTYCLRVQGDSMVSPHGRSYPQGCVIFVDPDLRSPPNGARVIAKLEGSDEVTFKVFVQEAGRTFLRPLNSHYPPIFDAFRVIGTVIGKWEDE